MTTPIISKDVVPTPVDGFIEALHVFLTTIMGDVPHRLNFPFELFAANDELHDMPNITIHIDKFLDVPEDPQNNIGPVYNVDWDIHVRQKLTDAESAGYDTHTYFRIWRICSYISARLHDSWIGPWQIGRLRAYQMSPDSVSQKEHKFKGNQEEIGAEGVKIRCNTRIWLDPTIDLHSTVNFNTGSLFGPEDPNAPIIERIDVTIRDGRGEEVAIISVPESTMRRN